MRKKMGIIVLALTMILTSIVLFNNILKQNLRLKNIVTNNQVKNSSIISIPSDSKIIFLKDNNTSFYIQLGVTGNIGDTKDFLEDIFNETKKIREEYNFAFLHDRDNLIGNGRSSDIEDRFLALSLPYKDLTITIDNIQVDYLNIVGDGFTGHGKQIKKVVKNGRIQFLGY